ncbi:MAG: PEP-CTERM sorting domain-containing protein [Phycisphaeraceae bacterium]
MNTKQLLTLAVGTAMTLGLVGTADAAPIVSESFDYSAGTVNGTQAGGTGFAAGGWNGSTTSVMYSINTSAIDVSGINGLSASAGKLTRNSAPGAAQISRGLSASAITALTADNSTIYFSIILQNNRFSTGNANDSFIIGTAPVPIGEAGNDPITIAGGEGFGVAFSGLGASPNGSIDIFGLAIDDGAGAKSAGSIDTGITGGTTSADTYFIVGQIDWKANGTADTLTLYNVTDTTGALPTAFATITADIDNSNIDTLAFAGEQTGGFDEIRIGATLEDVGVVPEPSSLALIGLGGLLIARRRRA